MYRPTIPLRRPQRMISTHGGQRRMLKRPMPAIDYIRQGVESGVYRTSEEIAAMLQQRKLQIDPVQSVMQRFRQDIVRGAYVHDYPVEYLILRQHPLPPDEPRVPKRQIRQLKAMKQREYVLAKKHGELPTKKFTSVRDLVKTYLDRQSTERHYTQWDLPDTFEDGSPLTSEEYYRRLLGRPKPSENTSVMGQKSAPLQKAYATALKHYELVRTQGMSNAQAMATVEELLKQADKDEYNTAAERVAAAQKLRQEQQDDQKAAAAQKKQEQQQQQVASATAAAIAQPPTTPSSDTPGLVGPTATMMDLAQQYQEKTDNKSWRTLQRGGVKHHDQDPTGDFYIPPARATETGPVRTKPLEPRSTRRSASTPPPPPPTGLERVYQNVLQSDPRALEAVMKWSQRLQTMPYHLWTVGASTALDHWIARQVLQFSEETWQHLLEGTDPDYLARGRQVIAAREALFPETILDSSVARPGKTMLGEDPEDGVEPGEYDDADGLQPLPTSPFDEKEKDSSLDLGGGGSGADSSLESLLASLGELTTTSMRNKDDANKKDSIAAGGVGGGDQKRAEFDFAKHLSNSALAQETLEQIDDRMTKIMDELQEWRRQHAETPFEQWTGQQQRELDDWIQNVFVPTCGSSSSMSMSMSSQAQEVDVTATRQALLSSPPVSREESTEFWSSLSNERDAALLLERMRQDGKPSPAAAVSILHASFWDLDYATQLQQLLNIGAIRPVLEEYTKESDRRAFLTKYGDILMTGVSLEYLVPDSKGPISVNELQQNAELMQRLGLTSTSSSNRRFRMERIPYRSGVPLDDLVPIGGTGAASGGTRSTKDQFQLSMEQSRALFLAWNDHKANRARYEEELFRQQRLGLTYDKTPKSLNDYTYEDYQRLLAGKDIEEEEEGSEENVENDKGGKDE